MKVLLERAPDQENIILSLASFCLSTNCPEEDDNYITDIQHSGIVFLH